ncbi:MAG: hypothetical protein V8Q30_08790 [Acutalibacteraceae bacterium]
MDLTEGTATFALSARPKEYRQDYSALFYALDGREATEDPRASYDGTRITAELTVPLSQSAEIDPTLRTPDSTEPPSWWTGSRLCIAPPPARRCRWIPA